MTDQPLSYWVAVARMGFEDDFNRLFDALGISRAELAVRMKCSPANVTKVLNGAHGNFQLGTMTKWARAVGGVVQIRVIKEDGEVVRVVDYETARAFDERQAATDAASSDTMHDKVVQLADHRKGRFETVAVEVTPRGEVNYG